MEIEAVEEPQPSTSRKKTKKKTKKHTLWKRSNNALLSFDTRQLPDDGPFDYTSSLQLVEQMWPSSLFTNIAAQTNIRYVMETGQELHALLERSKSFRDSPLLWEQSSYPEYICTGSKGFEFQLLQTQCKETGFLCFGIT